MRTFQFSDSKSHKFWTIEVRGTDFTVTYGKVGSTGRAQTKTFATAEQATAAADKLIAEKLKSGYAETTPKPAAGHVEAFERALADDPHSLVNWAVYADYLAEQADPRGEFMQVQIALEDESRAAADRAALKKQEAALLKKHEREWLGPLAAVTVDAEPVKFWGGGKQKTRPPVAHRFARGWVSRLEFHDLTVNQARALAKAPQAKFLGDLVVEGIDAEAPKGTAQRYVNSFYEPGPDVPADIDPYDGPGLHALCRCPQLAQVRRFQLGETAGEIAGEDDSWNCHTSGRLAYHVVKQMPNVEELYLLAHRVDANKLFALPMPKLRVLQLYHSDSYPLDRLAANQSLTKLTAILCHPHAYEDDGEGGGVSIRFAHLRAVCRSPHLTSLTRLRLRLTDFGDVGAAEIVESGILKRLTMLDLQGGCMTDEGARRLAGCPDLKHLEFLNLSRNALTDAGVGAIAATGVKANLDAQHTHGPGEFGDGEVPEYLFEGDIE